MQNNKNILKIRGGKGTFCWTFSSKGGAEAPGAPLATALKPEYILQHPAQRTFKIRHSETFPFTRHVIFHVMNSYTTDLVKSTMTRCFNN